MFPSRLDYIFTLGFMGLFFGPARSPAPTRGRVGLKLIGCRVLRAWSFALRASSPWPGGGRWYALVVEPSPTFRYRGSAADCPILPAFLPFALAVSSYAVGREAKRGFQQFTR